MSKWLTANKLIPNLDNTNILKLALYTGYIGKYIAVSKHNIS
jgi:hypothetical protein